jgi:hypothetical protein
VTTITEEQRCLYDPCQGVIYRTSLETESRETLLEIVQWRRVRWSRVAVAGAWEQFRNPEEGECLLLEAVTRISVQIVTEDTSVCVCVSE